MRPSLMLYSNLINSLQKLSRLLKKLKAPNIIQDKNPNNRDVVKIMTAKPTYKDLEQKVRSLKDEISDQRKKIIEMEKDKKDYQEIGAVSRLMLDNVPDMIWAKDIKDRFLFVNQSMCDNLLHAKSTIEPLGRSDLFFADRERKKKFEHTFGEICINSDDIVKKSHKSGRFLEDGLVRGKYLALDVHKAPFYSKSGKIIGTVGCARNVTKDIKINNDLKDSEQRFRQIMEDVTEISIQGYDEQRRVTFWNPYSEKLYGYSEKEALGKKLEDLIIPSEMKDVVVQLHGCWLDQGEKIPAGELILVDKFGNNVPVFSSHVMNETQSGKEMFCIDIDLRPIKESEAERERLLNQLRQSQKMEAMGTLAGGIAHDFNNILSPIFGHSEILLMDMSENNPFRKSVEEIYSAAQRATELVKQILTFSRQEPIELKSIRLQDVVVDALKLLRATISHSIQIKRNIDNTCGTVKADTTQIHQIVMNLSTNAYHAMEKNGGVLAISVKKVQFGEMDLTNPEMKPGKYVCLILSDTGVGIPTNIIEKIFDPFFTTKAKGKGTGLGLSTVHGIVAEMGGTIKVYSEPGKGTEFRVFFPEEDNSFKEESVHNPMSTIPGGNERILLVDDEEAIINLERTILERLGYKVTSLTNSIEALEMFRTAPREFDLVISDISMPSLNGDRLASELINIRPDIPILLCTGFSEIIIGKTAEDLGVRGFLMKPVFMDELANTIRNIMDSKKKGNTLLTS